MRRESVWTWAAEADAQEAFNRMENEVPGSGCQFVATTDRLVDLLQTFPQLAQEWQRPVRRALIRRSHYGLFYVVDPRRLVVIGLQDLRRDPERLKQDIMRRLP